MTPKRTEPKGKPFMRVPLNPPKKKSAENRPAGDPMKAVDRANRSQAMEAKEMKMTKKPMKKYAKGGKIDGCATKGKTKTKMVKMAMGGKAMMAQQGNNRGAAMLPGRKFKSGGSCGARGK
jgi:hypothetical protein